MTSRKRERGRRGRPSLPGEARRSVLLRAWFTPGEARLLREHAAARHLSVSRYLALLATRRRLPPLPPSRLEVSLVGQLGRIGNNLNQAVHLLHVGQLDPTFGSILGELRAAVSELRRRVFGEDSTP